MSGLHSARASFDSHFYWVIFLVAGILMALFLDRMVELAGNEEEALGLSTVSAYRAQAELYRELRDEDSIPR